MSTSIRVEHVPFLDLLTVHRELEEELVAVFRDALRSATFIGGPQVEAFEREFAEYCGTAHCVGVANGTDALRLALIACGVGRGDAVITVANTFIATVEAITQAGADVEFVDIDERTYCMSPSALEAYLASCEVDAKSGRPIGRRSGRPIAAILPVHLYGQMADMEPILRLADRYGLIVVEDACQAHGAEYQLSDGTWRRAGSLGRAAAFSFYPSKNLGACGDAGAVTTNDSGIARTIRALRDHGQIAKHCHELEGWNSRLDAIQAGLLRVKLAHLDAWNAQRRVAAAWYNEHLGMVQGLTVPFESPRHRSAYHLYVIRHARRHVLMKHLESEDIVCGLHYPVPVHLQKWCPDVADIRERLPVSEQVAVEVLSLPLFPGMDEADQRCVSDAVRRCSEEPTRS
jgi:dTDP-4-amino-4,6-dideoxygalactose transaminase